MDPTARGDGGELGRKYREAVYAAIQTARAVAAARKDFEVIATQCESIAGFRDVDSILREARQKEKELAGGPDLDVVVAEQADVRAKRLRAGAVVVGVAVILGTLWLAGAAATREEHKARYRSYLSANQEMLAEYGGDEYAAAQAAFARKRYKVASEQIAIAAQRGPERERAAKAERARLAAEAAERKRQADKAAYDRFQTISTQNREVLARHGKDEYAAAKAAFAKEDYEQARALLDKAVSEATERQRVADDSARLEFQEIQAQNSELLDEYGSKEYASAKASFAILQFEKAVEHLNQAVKRAATRKLESEQQDVWRIRFEEIQTQNGELLEQYGLAEYAAAKASFAAVPSESACELLNHAIKRARERQGESAAAQHRIAASARAAEESARLRYEAVLANNRTLLDHYGEPDYAWAAGAFVRQRYESACDLLDAAVEKATKRKLAAEGMPSGGAVTMENSLGMRFVPVPGTKVLFCIWETRVRDYRAFAEATGRVWPAPSFAQTPDHPAVNVSWDDAQAFCAWLTKKERGAGLLTGGQRYRLPTDAEWSLAVGVTESDGTPRDKDQKVQGVYPWGTAWPPPRGGGNYAVHEDGFAQTAPAGSFQAGPSGLFDLSGNALEWCEDFYDRQSGSRVLRGAYWGSIYPRGLLSSDRIGSAPSYRDDIFGFRCVLLR